MGFFKTFRTMVHHADFFSTTQLIRYQEDPDFKTFTGGLFSIAIVILLAVIFGSMSLSAVRRQQIDWAHQITKQSVPPKLALPFHTFNIGIQLQGMNLSSTVKYFDVVMVQKIFKNKILQAINQIPLTACQRKDWNLTADILGNFDRMNATNWYCPDPNSQFFVQGKWTSDDYNYLQISVLDCGSFHPNATCANQTEIATRLANKIHFSIYYVNALISPSAKEPVSYYMSDKDYIYFGNKLGSANEIFISDYQIETDHSILPYTDKRMEKGGFVMLPTTISTQEVGNGWYSHFVFRKATSKHIFTRAFAKFDTVISYIGGLFGAIIGSLYLMNHYTRTNFEISLGSLLYLDDQADEGEQFQQLSMNFCYYLAFWFYKIFKILGVKLNWQFFDRMDRYRTQVQKHLDIKLMLDKMNFFQRSLLSLCGEDKYKALHLREQVNLNQAKKLREYYYLRPMMIAQILKNKKQRKLQLQLKKKMMDSPIQQQSVKQSPMFMLGRGKIAPQNNGPSIKNQQCNNQDDKGSRSGDSHNTLQFTKMTRFYINQKKSNISQHEIQQDFDMGVPHIMQSLDTVWKMAVNGDPFCQQLWNNLDKDVKILLQKKFQRNNADFIIEQSVNTDRNNEENNEQ